MQVADRRITASVGSTIRGSGRSSTRTSPGAYITAPRITSSLFDHEATAGRPSPERAFPRWWFWNHAPPGRPRPRKRRSGPEPVGDPSHEVELAPLGVLVDLVADHHAREAALRADRGPVRVAAGERDRVLHPAEDLVLVLELGRLRRDDPHHHDRALAEMTDGLVAAVAAEVVPLDEERVVRQLAEHPLRDG